jgi:hypothetical protein
MIARGNDRVVSFNHSEDFIEVRPPRDLPQASILCQGQDSLRLPIDLPQPNAGAAALLAAEAMLCNAAARVVSQICDWRSGTILKQRSFRGLLSE